MTPAALLRRFAWPCALLCLWALVPPYSIAVVQALAIDAASDDVVATVDRSVWPAVVDLEQPIVLDPLRIASAAGPGGIATAAMPTGFSYGGGSVTVDGI